MINTVKYNLVTTIALSDPDDHKTWAMGKQFCLGIKETSEQQDASKGVMRGVYTCLPISLQIAG
jgi:hypothetical protein